MSTTLALLFVHDYEALNRDQKQVVNAIMKMLHSCLDEEGRIDKAAFLAVWELLAKSWRKSEGTDKPPKKEELAKLPRLAMVALAGQAAQRALPFSHGGNFKAKEIVGLVKGVAQGEGVTTQEVEGALGVMSKALTACLSDHVATQEVASASRDRAEERLDADAEESVNTTAAHESRSYQQVVVCKIFKAALDSAALAQRGDNPLEAAVKAVDELGNLAHAASRVYQDFDDHCDTRKYENDEEREEDEDSLERYREEAELARQLGWRIYDDFTEIAKNAE